MANRTVDTPWNTLTPQQWIEGWKQMQEPGAYERGIYGDLMLPGIACGVRKKLLIFNTNPDTPHDPIYITDPSDFNVNPDSDIPILLAYNMSHYESLEPLEEADLIATINLVKEYQAGKYRYGRKDMHTLISLEFREYDEETQLTKSKHVEYVPDMRTERDSKEIIIKGRIEGKNKINQEETEACLDEVSPCSKTEDIAKPQARADAKMHSNTKKIINNLCYRLKKIRRDLPIKEIDGKMECPFCKVGAKNLKLHLERKPECEKNIDMAHFSESYNEYMRIIGQEKEKLKRQKKLEKDPHYSAKAMKKSRAKQQAEDPKKYKETQKEKREQERKRQLEADPDIEKKRKAKSSKKLEAEDPMKYKQTQKEKQGEARKRQLEADQDIEKKRKAKSRGKQQAADPVKYKQTQREKQEEARK